MENQGETLTKMYCSIKPIDCRPIFLIRLARRARSKTHNLFAPQGESYLNFYSVENKRHVVIVSLIQY